MNEDGLCAALKNLHHIIISNLRLTLEDHLVTLNRNYLTSILINEILVPALKHTGCQLGTNILLQGSLIDLHLLSKVEDLEDLLIRLESDGTKQCRYRQLLLTIDISIHHIVDVGSKLDPRTLERNNTCGIQQRTVSMYTLAEEHAR